MQIRCVSLVAACVMSAACAPTEPSTVTLLQESFSGADYTSRWVVSTSASCSASNADGDALGAPTQGNPTPGMVFKCAAGLGGTLSSLRSIDTYQLGRDHQFAADARVDAVGSFPANPQPGLEIAIKELNTGMIYALVWVRADQATYYVRRKTGSGYVQQTRIHAADGQFHRFELRVTANGTAEWWRDDALQLSATDLDYDAPEHAYLMLTAPPPTAGSASEGHLDNVRIIRR